MKKVILTTLAICATSITINQLLSNKYSKKTTENVIQTEISTTLNQDDIKIEKLNQEYNSRTNQLNQEMENNLVASITLINNQITINYQILNPKLYSKEVYQMILSKQYLENLKVQQQLNLVSFDSNNHINFNNSVITIQHNPNFWKEWHWYWFIYWKLHLSINAIDKIIDIGSKMSGSPGFISAASTIAATLITSGFAAVIAAIIAGFILRSIIILLVYSNSVKGCWLGIMGVVPGVKWGSN
ncbi:hypothetical protein [Spiroplasma attinicola]|uniref:hypothetical protein n=1 Tax=Spiroplasma attinicola TaxID=2904537 RepID=UPI002022B296|nr:hypothetical protein [Spiroplasma sp. JKS002670]MCL8210063.1 hypothetical protein [Spiroplasma sp. JKS002670]